MSKIIGRPLYAPAPAGGGKPSVPKFTYDGDYVIRDDGVVELLTSGTIVFLEPKVIDVFMVGGGGAGNSGKSTDPTTSQMGYGGGGGGYTKTVRRVNVAANSAITVTIGAGGVPFLAGGTDGNATTFGTIASVDGGKGKASNIAQASRVYGNNGGSGGGGGVKSNSDYGAGGYDGNNGESGYPTSNQGGNGQQYTAREFGEAGGKLYAGGGGGGRYMNSTTPIVSLGGAGGGGNGAWAGSSDELTQAATAGVANTGGGGGGSAARTWNTRVPPASGGSGIVCFRDAQELPELAGTWVLNERLYEPENWSNENVTFTATNTAGTTLSVNRVRITGTSSSSSGKILELNTYTAIYYFKTNAWVTGQSNSKYNKWTFPSGATASEAFRAWLASNATKQTA